VWGDEEISGPKYFVSNFAPHFGLPSLFINTSHVHIDEIIEWNPAMVAKKVQIWQLYDQPLLQP